MVCLPRKVGDYCHAVFELFGHQYTATLRTKAERRIVPIRGAIYRIESITES